MAGKDCHIVNQLKMENIIIREAREDEAPVIAELLMMAWPVEDIMASNGISYEELHETVTAIVSLPATIYSYEHTFVAEVDGRVAGAMCGYDGADYQALKQPIVDALGEDSEFARLQETEAGEYYLDSVGVHPDFRGRGIGSMLFEAQIARAANQGHKQVGLIVDVDKPEAEALYERLGFSYLDDKDFFGHKMKHMIHIL